VLPLLEAEEMPHNFPESNLQSLGVIYQMYRRKHKIQKNKIDCLTPAFITRQDTNPSK